MAWLKNALLSLMNLGDLSASDAETINYYQLRSSRFEVVSLFTKKWPSLLRYKAPVE